LFILFSNRYRYTSRRGRRRRRGGGGGGGTGIGKVRKWRVRLNKVSVFFKFVSFFKFKKNAPYLIFIRRGRRKLTKQNELYK